MLYKLEGQSSTPQNPCHCQMGVVLASNPSNLKVETESQEQAVWPDCLRDPASMSKVEAVKDATNVSLHTHAHTRERESPTHIYTHSFLLTFKYIFPLLQYKKMGIHR